MKLVLVYTLKCNAACKMCCFSCNPGLDEKMDVSAAVDIIKQAASCKAIEEISFTGGEALLYKDEIEDLIELCHKNNIKTQLTTNAFWAASVEEAHKMLSSLKNRGLDELGVSTDEFHQCFIPYRNIENLITANEKTGLPLEFKSVITKKTAEKHPLEIKYPEHKWEKGICQPVGQAESEIPEDDYIHIGYEGKCVYTNTLTIMPDGSCYPCCSQGVRLDGLRIGSAYEQTLEALIAAKESHMFTKVISSIGPKLLKQKGEEQGHFLTEGRGGYVSLCHLCHVMGKDMAYLEKMKGIIEDTAYMIDYSQLMKT